MPSVCVCSWIADFWDQTRKTHGWKKQKQNKTENVWAWGHSFIKTDPMSIMSNLSEIIGQYFSLKWIQAYVLEKDKVVLSGIKSSYS